MSWHIPRSLVNELISAQREQLNTGFLLLSLANRGDGESAGRRRGGCASLASTGAEVIVMHLAYIFVLLVLSSRALVCLIRVSKVITFPGKGVQLIINSMLQGQRRGSALLAV